MRGYGLPGHLDLNDIDDDDVEVYGLKNGKSEDKRNASIKRNIRKAQRHGERFRSKSQIRLAINELN